MGGTPSRAGFCLLRPLLSPLPNQCKNGKSASQHIPAMPLCSKIRSRSAEILPFRFGTPTPIFRRCSKFSPQCRRIDGKAKKSERDGAEGGGTAPYGARAGSGSANRVPLGRCGSLRPQHGAGRCPEPASIVRVFKASERAVWPGTVRPFECVRRLRFPLQADGGKSGPNAHGAAYALAGLFVPA